MRTVVGILFVAALVVAPWGIAAASIIGGVGLLFFLVAVVAADSAASERAAPHWCNVAELERQYRSDFGNLEPPKPPRAGDRFSSGLNDAAGVAGALGVLGFVGQAVAAVAGAALDHAANQRSKSPALRRQELMWANLSKERQTAAEVAGEATGGSFTLFLIMAAAFAVRAGIENSNEGSPPAKAAPAVRAPPSSAPRPAVTETIAEPVPSGTPPVLYAVTVSWSVPGGIGLFSAPFGENASTWEKDGARKRQLAAGENVSVLEETDSRWLLVKTADNEVGYISRRYTARN